MDNKTELTPEQKAAFELAQMVLSNKPEGPLPRFERGQELWKAFWLGRASLEWHATGMTEHDHYRADARAAMQAKISRVDIDSTERDKIVTFAFDYADAMREMASKQEPEVLSDEQTKQIFDIRNRAREDGVERGTIVSSEVRWLCQIALGEK